MGLGHSSEVFHVFDKTLFDVRTWVLKRYVKYGGAVSMAKEILNEIWNPEREFR
jgi:hypothetical protein